MRTRPTEGGSYIKQRNGSLKRVEFTKPHPDGNRARPASAKATADKPAEARSAKAEAGVKSTANKGG